MPVSKKIPAAAFIFFCALSYAYGATSRREALEFAKAYEKEIATQSRPAHDAPEDKSTWKSEISLKTGQTTYEEAELNLNSDWKAFYGEAVYGLSRETPGDIAMSLNIALGSSVTHKETWFVSDEKYQTNDMGFLRANFKASIGKILYSDKYRDLRVIPFLGYGFRFIRFERTNFNVLNIVTSRDVVSEKYYIHHIDAGVRFDKKVGQRLSVYGLGSYGQVVSSLSTNSAFGGKIEGGGGLIVDGGLGVLYALNESTNFKFGGFAELQNLNGGQRDNIIWPDNKLNIYGGELALQYTF